MANAALITTKHTKFTTKPKEEDAAIEAPPATHPTRDSDGYPLQGFDEVGVPLLDLEHIYEEP